MKDVMICVTISGAALLSQAAGFPLQRLVTGQRRRTDTKLD